MRKNTPCLYTCSLLKQRNTQQSQTGYQGTPSTAAIPDDTYPGYNWTPAAQGHHLGQGQRQICQGGQGRQCCVREPIDSNSSPGTLCLGIIRIATMPDSRAEQINSVKSQYV